ncbi:MAG: hypothetical protein JW699_02490 [Chitinispirillaceae bacterium]|nr:hypothetical protein [Chitinispirillaceae bacterium]
MRANYLKYPLLIVYSAAIVLAFHTRYSGYHGDLPQGCDEFGYLNSAKAAAEGKLFKEHAERPFDPELREYLRRSPLDFSSYEYMIAPHAYSLHKKGKIINQYPPGTGLLLSPLPFHLRKAAFPAVCAAVLVLFLVLAFKVGNGGLSLFTINLIAVLASAAFISDAFPWTFGNFNWVNSHAPSLGMLLAAGYLFDRRPGWSMALLGTSVLFRVVNAILFVPLLLVYLWKGFRLQEYLSRETAFRIVRATFFFLVGGMGLYFLYMWCLLGNPLLSTYPEDYLRETFIAPLYLIPGNIRYHIAFSNPWFLFHFVIMGFIVCMGLFRKMPWKWVIAAAVITLFNYVFFVLHRIAGPLEQRYLYASGMIIAGIFLRHVEKYVRNSAVLRRIVNGAGAVFIIAAIVFSAVRFPRQDTQALFYDQIRAYDRCFSGYDVVWAEHRSGTVEYATGKAGFRYQWGPGETRKAVMSWLSANGYRQAVWVSDLEKHFTDSLTVESELKSIPLDYTVKTCGGFGTIIEVR